MQFFELDASDISDLTDADLRELVARLCEAELIGQNIQPSCVFWGGAQEAPDGGLDVRVKDANPMTTPAFVPRENTGFQVKKHTMGKSACSKEMLDKGNVKPIIQHLADLKGAYIIVSGKDDCSDKMLESRQEGMRNALDGVSNKEDLLIDFYGRDRLSNWLRQHPGVSLWVRLKIGKPLHGWQPFGRWAATPVGQDDEFLSDDHPCVIDYDSVEKKPISILDGIQSTRTKLAHKGACLRITGLSGVGKTRFAQALFEPEVGDNSLAKSNVIYADLGGDLSPSASELVTYLIANNYTTCLVLDNCPPDVHRSLQKQVSSSGSKLSLLTIEYDISDDKPEETNVIHLEPSSEKTVSALLQKRFPVLGQVNSDKIAEFSGGNSRVALALASRVDSDETLTNFSDDQLFQRLFSQRKGENDSLLESAEALSLVYSFNVSSSENNDELRTLGEITGIGRKQLYRDHAELLRRQLSQQRGDWRAVLPHALANRLAKRALESIELSEINKQLFKPENRRLLESCAHRLGYLHDFPRAHDLANSWLDTGGPLCDVSSYDEKLLSVLRHIAPVFPQTVLSVIEAAAKDPDFTSRKNGFFSTYVRLLTHIAYEDQSFDRCAEIILKFSLTEKAGENNNSIVNQLKHLFSLKLSGTHARPERRQAFLGRLIDSNDERHIEIARELFDAAFESSHWTSFGSFDFGARSRDFGWLPKSNEERLAWYEGFIKLLVPLLNSDSANRKSWAKSVLASHFRELWVFAGCFDSLEEIITAHGQGGSWPEMWISVKQTINFDGERHTTKLYEKLTSLEKILAPDDPFSEIQAFAFTNTWEHSDLRGGNYLEDTRALHKRISNLGQIAVSETDYLSRLSSQLWKKHIDALLPFGEGLAIGSADITLTFELLVKLMQEQSLEAPEPILFAGYIVGVSKSAPDLVEKLLKRVLEIPKLKQNFVYLATAIPLSDWVKENLISLARNKELEAWRFEYIRNGRLHEQISDKDLAALVSAINELEYGVFSSIRILGMRFHIDKASEYRPSDELTFVGRATLLKLLSFKRSQLSGRTLHDLHELDLVAKYCLGKESPASQIQNIIEALHSALASFDLFYIDLEDISYTLCENFPEMMLDYALLNQGESVLAEDLMFRETSKRDVRPLNFADVSKILNWCDQKEERIQEVAKLISAFSTLKDADNSELVVLSKHAIALLDAAKSKDKILKTFMHQAIWPTNGSLNSFSDSIEERARAFSELLEYPDPEVRQISKDLHLSILETASKERKEEEERNKRREQRFE